MLLSILITVLGAYLTLHVVYLAVVIAARFLILGRPPGGVHPRTRFRVLIPAHNEELLLPRLLDAVRHQEYPSHLYKTFVIAENLQ